MEKEQHISGREQTGTTLPLEDRLALKDHEITKLSCENQELLHKTQELQHRTQELEQRKQELEFQLAQLKRMLFGSKRERFVPMQHPSQLTLDFELETPKIEAEIEKEQISYQRSKAKKQHPGREALPSHLPVVEVVIEPKEDVSEMTCIGREVTDELEYTPAKLYIKRYIRPKYMSKPDQDQAQKQTIAELDRPMSRCIAGPELLSLIVTDKYVYHLPIYRQLQRFIQEGVHIKSSTMDSWLALVAEHIRPLFPVHRSYVLNANYLQADESPIKVLDRDKPGATHQGYMWVYRSPMQDAVFFDYNKGRGFDAPKKYLSEFKGYLQTDGYPVYDRISQTPDIVHLNCWAHARRYFEKALSNDKERASHILGLIQQIYAVEREAREAELKPEQLHQLRLEKSLPVLNSIGKYIGENRSAVLPKSAIGEAFEYCANRWDRLLNYLKDGNLEIDSNQIENTIRPLALGRKNYLFAGSHDAAQNIAMYYSFFATCKKHGINPQKWLAHIIRNIGDTKTSQLKSLLPQFIDKSRIE